MTIDPAMNNDPPDEPGERADVDPQMGEADAPMTEAQLAEAKEYGLVDDILTKPPASGDEESGGGGA